MDVERIKEAEELLEEAYIIMDLQREEISELKAQNRMLIKQIQTVKVGQEVDYGVA